MGNSASKTTRILDKGVKLNHQPSTLGQGTINNLKKQVTADHLKNKIDTRNSEASEKKESKHQVFTQRPPSELEQMGDSDSAANGTHYEGNRLFEKAVSAGLVKVQDSTHKQSYNPNHESLQVLKNRVNVEKQYEGLFIPKDADKPNVPERFLNEEQKKSSLDPEAMLKKTKKTGINSFGLFDSGVLSDLIVDYKVFGEAKYIEKAKEIDANDENIVKLKKFIDDGIINLPTHKVTLKDFADPASKQMKQKLVTVKDDWVKTIKEDIEKEKINKLDSKSTTKTDLEVFEQFKMLENLVSKSQISTKKVDGPLEESELVMNRRKKQVVKEVKKML
ncbi:hypothetical protein PICMEDRAFT_14576 [Pichia membranifaciens NRRL Y-2026]|uniref:Uncharacterized protein n=1 Tax=Pichia membranifaciens NRRL Y-2026 TaxID=763406 RepID=A0A1E3NSL4_9ASCO|nr:hypothetical protein PICMEDRAFT_14576 [Pichia membranifaciens NRRL Y-2026]ODQ49091.1 hypothetical protein PICMEDRAFT_14576 [Pichia membranifaciens NRRL Y-2026]